MPENSEIEVIEVTPEDGNNDNEEEPRQTEEESSEQLTIVLAELERLGANISGLSDRIGQLEQSDRQVHEQVSREPEPKQHFWSRRIW
jgi:hypothetical protein